ncbi:MAG: sigma 54-interacting transcriptional regulator [Burkholderiaceae bacterium]
MAGIRNLICVGVCGDDECDSIRAALCDQWDVSVARGIHAGDVHLRRKKFQVGILLVTDPACANPGETMSLLHSHPGLQWIGVFPAGIGENDPWRDLIIDSLVDFHTLPIDPARLASTVGHTYGMARLLDQIKLTTTAPGAPEIVGNSAVMAQLQRQIRKVARVDAPVLVSGESGVGKELAAQQLHLHSARAAGPFVPVNCGAIPASLIQSELFGYERGAFTGAAQSRVGMFESASGGTLFLDEIADLSLELQTNLLRFLQERTICRVGSTQSIRLDVRIIAATHVDLEEAVKQGRFRQDLFYRLNVLALTVPPLRDRKEDVALLASHFFAKYATEKNARLLGFSTRAIHALEAHSWPGNVRELINRVRRAMVMAEGRLIKLSDLELERRAETRFKEELGDVRIHAEKHAIVTGLHRAHRNVSQAARDLGVSRMTLYRLMAKHDISL